MITFLGAREITKKEYGPQWAGGGEFWVAEHGYEDARGYLMVIGNKEWLVQKNPRYNIIDETVILIDKKTGKMEVTDHLYAMDRIEKMTPVQATG